MKLGQAKGLAELGMIGEKEWLLVVGDVLWVDVVVIGVLWGLDLVMRDDT